MSSDSPTFGSVDFPESDAFKPGHVMSLFSDPATNPSRSKSDPVAVVKDPTSLIREQSEEALPSKWTSNSDPNLAASKRLTPPDSKVATSQDVQLVVKEVVKTELNRKGSSGSTDGMRSPIGSPFEQHAFPQHRSDSQKSMSSTTSIPDSPISISSPKPKPVSFSFLHSSHYD